ncbi:threonine/serine exporter family protein [Vagococcus humatus]|nr:threonine/serine exporter family protein [Vagococcus humatus]
MERTEFLLETCVLAGKIMLENGAEMSRVEDTMNRIAASYGEEVGTSFVTQTVVLMGLQSTKDVQMQRIEERTTNLGKIAKVNTYSRAFAENKLSLQDLNTCLVILDQAKSYRSRVSKIISAAIVSGCLMVMLGGTWPDFLATCLVGAGGYGAYDWCEQRLNLKFINELVASIILGVLAFLCVDIGIAHSLDHMIIGSIMPLVPGVAITNAVRDLQAGHMLAGISRAVEALIVALMIGAGIAIAFSFMH